MGETSVLAIISDFQIKSVEDYVEVISNFLVMRPHCVSSPASRSTKIQYIQQFEDNISAMNHEKTISHRLQLVWMT